MGMFGKIIEAQYSEGGVYVLPGVYRLKVLRCKADTTRTNRNFFVVEFEILESNNPERAVGSVCSWMVMLDKEPSLGNVRHFCEVATDCSFTGLSAQEAEQCVEEIVSQQNPLAGVIVRASAVNTIAKTTGRPFTKVKFLPDSTGREAAIAENSKAS